MCTRCVACNTELHDNEMLTKRSIELRDAIMEMDDGNLAHDLVESLEMYEDMCNHCRSITFSQYNILDKEYEHSMVTEGVGDCAGFSDNY